MHFKHVFENLGEWIFSNVIRGKLYPFPRMIMLKKEALILVEGSKYSGSKLCYQAMV